MNNNSYNFNQFEIALCGYSNSGKTTLLTKLIKHFSQKYRLAYLKHDAHHFDLDKEGKDTYEARQNGASQVLINDAASFALLNSKPFPHAEHKKWLKEADIVLVEGYKNSTIPKMIMLDAKAEIMERFSEFQNVFAIIGREDYYPDLPAGIPYFQRDELDKIINCIEGQLLLQENEIPLYGLVLCGKKSNTETNNFSRINEYFEILAENCEKVFISAQKEVCQDDALRIFPQIWDRFLHFGPLGGILTAQSIYPEAAWLVIAHDFEGINWETVAHLISNRMAFKAATLSHQKGELYRDGLFGIYEPKSHLFLMERVAMGEISLQEVLNNLESDLLYITDKSYYLNQSGFRKDLK